MSEPSNTQLDARITILEEKWEGLQEDVARVENSSRNRDNQLRDRMDEIRWYLRTTLGGIILTLLSGLGGLIAIIAQSL